MLLICYSSICELNLVVTFYRVQDLEVWCDVILPIDSKFNQNQKMWFIEHLRICVLPLHSRTSNIL